MDRINEGRTLDDTLQPWQLFDMIGGTSTGGIIAIMLGRLRMTLEDCEDAYLQLSEKIFTPRRTSRIMQKWDFLNANGKFDGEVFEEAIKHFITAKFPELSADALLKDQEASCKTFVVAARESNSEPAILRSYKNPEKEWLLSDECAIWQACRATSAATTFFEPVSIGKFGQRFVDGGILYNNPIQLVALEARDLWPEQEAIILNIGTGSPTSPRFAGNLADIAAAMGRILTRCENTYNEFFESHQEMVGRGLLFRFNVIHGLEHVGLNEYNEVARIVDATETYLDDPKTRKELKACVEKLSGITIKDHWITSDESRQIKNWLSPINSFVTQHDKFDRRQEGTGRWFLEASEFTDWVSSSGKTLLCPGRAGVGKTILSSIVIEHLRRVFEQDSNVGVAWIYCDYNHTDVQTPVNLIAGLWRTLLDRDNPSQEAKSLYQRHADHGTSPRLTEMSELLKSEARRYSRVFIVVDALDECLSDTHTGIGLVRELKALRPVVNLMVTARSLKILQRDFNITTTLEVIASADDIRNYVGYRISEEPRLSQHVSEDATLREDIIQAVLETSKGMYGALTTEFLIAFHQMNELARKHTITHVRRALTTLPSELDEFHQETVRRIECQNRDDRQLAWKILLWVSYTLRPLTFNELLHALAIEPGKAELDQMSIPKETDVESLCDGLLVVDRNSGLVHFVHFTAQSYFETIRGTIFPEAHNSIATNCLTYLLFDVFATDLCTNEEAWDARLQKYPLLDYAARHWGDHVREEQEGGSTKLAMRLLTKKQHMLCAVRAMLSYQWPPSRYFLEQVTGLHVAAKFGLAGVAWRLLANGADVNAKDGNELTALHIAAQHGHTQVIRVLLEHADINVNLQNEEDQTALSLAAQMGHLDAVKLLVGRDDIWVNARDHENWTPLLCALHEGHEAVAEQIVSTDRFTANSKDEDGRTPLSWAAEKGLSAAVHWLLARGDVDVDSEDNKRRTPLFWATHGSGEVMRQLLEEGEAQINKSAMDGSTALHEAVKELFEEAVVLLLRHRADFEAEDECKMSAMDVALVFGSVQMVKVLLTNGVRLRMDSNGNTALHAIVYNFNDQAIRQMRSEREKRQVNITWYNNDMPAMIDPGLGRYDEMVQLLVDNGIDIDGHNKDGRTPLQTATIEGHETLVKILLMHQANIDADDRYGATPLLLALSLGNDAMAQRLLEHGANIEAEAKDGIRPLHLSAYSGNLAMTQMLLENGANIHAQDNKGATALHIATFQGHERLVAVLLDNEADIQLKDCHGMTALSLASMFEHKSIERVLEALHRNNTKREHGNKRARRS